VGRGQRTRTTYARGRWRAGWTRLSRPSRPPICRLRQPPIRRLTTRWGMTWPPSARN